MIEKNAASWEEFEQILNDIKNQYPKQEKEFLYRGQSDSKWKLETTLERKVKHQITLERYYNFIATVKGKIETATDKTWNIPTKEKYTGWLTDLRSDVISGFLACEYFAYLRHHGFPSPLLDWSKSPYVATYFAMNKTNENESEDISLFMFMDSKLGVKIWDNQSPGINKIDQYLKTHKRHYLQQAVYTICTAFEGNEWYYTNHEEVFLANDENQDLLWKIKIPKNKRKEFLSKLEHMNINSFSLFQTEDALMEHIFISEGYIGENL